MQGVYAETCKIVLKETKRTQINGKMSHVPGLGNLVFCSASERQDRGPLFRENLNGNPKIHMESQGISNS